MNEEYTSLDPATPKVFVEPKSSNTKKYLRSLTIVGIIGIIGLLVYISQSNGFGHSTSATHGTSISSHAVISTSALDYDYTTNKLLSYLSDTSQDSYISDDCEFVNIDSDNYETTLKDLLLDNDNNNVIHFETTTISKPLYTVEWIFGTKTSNNNENEHFAVVFQIDPNDDNKIFEMHLFTSQYSDETAEALYRRLFNAFDFNKNGVLCITEFPSMMGAISGLGNIEMSNSLLSYMSDKDNHIKFTEDEFVELVSIDDNANNVHNFGDLRHIVQNAVIDGYMAFNNEENTCVYYDLSWNCQIMGNYYNTAEDSEPVFSVSDSIFASVCCNSS